MSTKKQRNEPLQKVIVRIASNLSSDTFTVTAVLIYCKENLHTCSLVKYDNMEIVSLNSLPFLNLAKSF